MHRPVFKKLVIPGAVLSALEIGAIGTEQLHKFKKLETIYFYKSIFQI